MHLEIDFSGWGWTEGIPRMSEVLTWVGWSGALPSLGVGAPEMETEVTFHFVGR